ncbi:hypothetical protein [Streptomyces sp. CdTB01]|uniref:hypothetical protein n=1 Tax=Streptomyces sp. CdTB01 TaxID=1725411 RepID=UPI00073ABF6B|nr:hypothetical protein [Streptomyces sp. CdTB01]ALV31053.1 hypothetical protein AS200_02410 [Streptomyces sp. CdTB01]
MRRHQRAAAAVFVTTVVLTALAPQAAVAAPMPWETSKTPTTTTPTRHVAATAHSERGMVTVLCTGGCYQ